MPFLLRMLPGGKLLLRFLAGDAVRLLDLSRELLALARARVELIAGELAPVPQGVALEMLPVAFNAIPFHLIPFWQRSGCRVFLAHPMMRAGAPSHRCASALRALGSDPDFSWLPEKPHQDRFRGAVDPRALALARPGDVQHAHAVPRSPGAEALPGDAPILRAPALRAPAPARDAQLPRRVEPRAVHARLPAGDDLPQQRLALARQLAALDQLREIARPADQHAFDEHHRERRPAGPHLQRKAPSPLAEVAAVLEILVCEPCVIKQLPRLLGERVLAHADHDELVRRHGIPDLLQDAGAMARDLFAHRGMDLLFGKNAAGHRTHSSDARE